MDKEKGLSSYLTYSTLSSHRKEMESIRRSESDRVRGIAGRRVSTFPV